MAGFIQNYKKQQTETRQDFDHTVTPIYGSIGKSIYLPTEVYKKLSRQEFELLSKTAENLIETLPAYEVTDTKIRMIGRTQLMALAVVQCTETNTLLGNRYMPYDPRSGTIDDPKMGTLTMDRDCQSCFQNTVTCPGHLGYIELARPIVNPLFRKVLIYIMNIFCEECNEPYFVDRTKLPNDQLDSSFYDLLTLGPLGRLKVLSEKYAKSKTRPHEHHSKNPVYVHQLSPADKSTLSGTVAPKKSKFATTEKEEASYSVNLKRRMGAVSIGRPDEGIEAKDLRYTIFKKNDDTVSYVPIQFIKDRLARINPQWFDFIGIDIENTVSNIILELLPVIPPIARVYGTVDREPSIDPLTEKYCEILKINSELLKRPTGHPQSGLYMAELYNEIIALFTLIQEQIKGKKGIIRGLSMGKRVDFSGRSVLTTYNELIFGYIAVPNMMKKYFTKTITVNYYNREECLKLYYDKRVPYLIINSDLSRKGNRLPVTEKMITEYEPQISDQIEIEGMDGDEVLFNRQPTLHKQGMMGHKAVFVNNHGIGLLSAYTTPYNADFDGDEGNLHKLQTIDARTECRYVADVGSCIMNSQSNKPIIGLVYNSVTAAYVLTDDKTVVIDHVFNTIIRILSSAGTVGINFVERLTKANRSIQIINSDLKDENKIAPIKRDSGKLLFSLLFPEDFYYDAKGIKIRHGILISGRVGKEHIGPSAGSIIHHLWKMYGKERTMLFLTQGQWLLDEYIEKRGFTIGIGACLPQSVDSANKINDIINSEVESAKLKIEGLGPIVPGMNLLEKEQHEIQIRSKLDVIGGIGKRISLEALSDENPLNVMFRGGAKGSATNIGQIIACLGQQYIKGVRPPNNMSMNTRTLPYFAPHDESIEARGFIRESFMEGMNPASFTFHMMASRIGIMDTALKTADTGHMHHRINKALEDFKYTYDGSVTNMNGTIFQYNYSDGFDAGNLIPSQSESLGNVINFIDLKSVIGKLNSDAGYETI